MKKEIGPLIVWLIGMLLLLPVLGLTVVMAIMGAFCVFGSVLYVVHNNLNPDK